MKKYIPLHLLFLTLMLACGGIKGTFAVKTILEDTYRKVPDILEVEQGKELQWIYRFDRVPSGATIGIVLLKKEISWVDVNTTSETLPGKKNIIYGNISRLPRGKYRIVLTNVAKGNAIIDELAFTVYSDEERN